MGLKRAFAASALALIAALWCGAALAQDEGADDGIIHLHMPVHHHPLHRPAPGATRPSSEPASADAIGAEPASAPPPAPAAIAPAHPVAVAPAPARSASPTPAKAPARSSATHNAPAIPFSFGDDSEAPPAVAPQAAEPARASPVKTASIPPHETRESPAAGSDHTALTKRGAVMFDKGVSDPSPAQFKGVKLLAGDLSQALESGVSRVELEAYGGAPGDKSSDARRLSLKRALAVRQLLIDSGVPSARIDVRAMGGIDDHGSPDRVDVFVRT
jgi:outer membrane protein OmpA-like peptidoglycan-associated protein